MSESKIITHDDIVEDCIKDVCKRYGDITNERVNIILDTLDYVLEKGTLIKKENKMFRENEYIADYKDRVWRGDCTDAERYVATLSDFDTKACGDFNTDDMEKAYHEGFKAGIKEQEAVIKFLKKELAHKMSYKQVMKRQYRELKEKYKADMERHTKMYADLVQENHRLSAFKPVRCVPIETVIDDKGPKTDDVSESDKDSVIRYLLAQKNEPGLYHLGEKLLKEKKESKEKK